MTKWLALPLVLLALPPLQQFVRESNSALEMRRGVAAYQKGDYAEAARAFARAAELDRSARAAFDEGTAKIAQKDVAGGSKLLQTAMRDPRVRAAALYNRGTGELGAKAYEPAIRDLTDALRADPKNVSAKRNLELARQRLEEQQKQQGSGGSNKQQSGGSGSGQNGPPKRDAQSASQPQPRSAEDAAADALLRAVQEQENEELGRMRHHADERRSIGW